MASHQEAGAGDVAKRARASSGSTNAAEPVLIVWRIAASLNLLPKEGWAINKELVRVRSRCHLHLSEAVPQALMLPLLALDQLVSLKLSTAYNFGSRLTPGGYPLQQLLPPSLQHLTFRDIHVPADLVLPKGLMSLRIEESDIDELCDADSEFPDDIYASLPALPPELQSLTVAFSYMSDTCAFLKLGTLPPSLQYLEVSIPASDCWGMVDLQGLPESLRVLRIKEGMSPTNLVALPPHLEVLELDYPQNVQMPPLPQSLRQFRTGGLY
eukprot:TRINITY_DN7545_c0_g1_i3.p1 TRINITY_DN7545_c0_g1~~TRINITY_DN7545_c0_g1_i3.p1  ORF type:complete len:293 (+),score=47.35 TRINITY_DN7545_c0_g1_i3:74-880(+)